MLDWNELYLDNIIPSWKQITEYINDPLFEELDDYLKQTYNAETKLEYSCSVMPGWNIKYKKDGKLLCALYPMRTYFTVLVPVGIKEMQAAEALIASCSDFVRKIFERTKADQGQKRLVIDVMNEKTVDDIRELIAIKYL